MSVSSLIVEVPVAVLPLLFLPRVASNARARLLKLAEDAGPSGTSSPVVPVDGCGELSCLGGCGCIIGQITLLAALAVFYLVATGHVPPELQPTDFGLVAVPVSWTVAFIGGEAIRRGWGATAGLAPELASRARAVMEAEQRERERERAEARDEQRKGELESRLEQSVGVPVLNTESLANLSGDQFERLCGEYFKLQGYNVSYTPSAADGGIDLVLRKGSEKVIVQCKRHAKPVGEPTIRDLYGVVLHENANAGIVCGSAGFTSSAKAWVKGKPINLVDGAEILRGIRAKS